MNDLSMIPFRVPPVVPTGEEPVVYRAAVNYPLLPGDNVVYFSKALETDQYDVRPFCRVAGMSVPWAIGWKNMDCFMINVDEECTLDYTLLPVR